MGGNIMGYGTAVYSAATTVLSNGVVMSATGTVLGSYAMNPTYMTAMYDAASQVDWNQQYGSQSPATQTQTRTQTQTQPEPEPQIRPRPPRVDQDRQRSACFAAGTRLWTPAGFRPIESIRAGESVYARDEWDALAPAEAKVVEETFVASGVVWHLHVSGRVIRTSGSHPFYGAGRGWVACEEIAVGDSLLCADGTPVVVEARLDTGETEILYNLRVADHHTYSMVVGK